MARKLYDLCTADRDVRLSPPCWVAKFALMHKGLDFETVPLGFTEKDKLPDPEYGRFPILDDDGDIVRDSMTIVSYLEEKHPEKPLFETNHAQASASFYQAFLGAHLFPALAPLMFIRVHDALNDDNKAYFRESREKRFGVTLEALAAQDGLSEKTEAALATLAAPLSDHAFYGGDSPNLCDYVVAGPFMWKHALTDEHLFETPNEIAAWFERILDLFDGYARKAPRAA